jgi:hypothetical protein
MNGKRNESKGRERVISNRSGYCPRVSFIDHGYLTTGSFNPRKSGKTVSDRLPLSLDFSRASLFYSCNFFLLYME